MDSFELIDFRFNQASKMNIMSQMMTVEFPIPSSSDWDII